jgi:hypothetical protein
VVRLMVGVVGGVESGVGGCESSLQGQYVLSCYGSGDTLDLTTYGGSIAPSFLDDAYCSPSIVPLALLSRPLSSSGLLFFCCYCSPVSIVLVTLIVLPFR